MVNEVRLDKMMLEVLVLQDGGLRFWEGGGVRGCGGDGAPPTNKNRIVKNLEWKESFFRVFC